MWRDSLHRAKGDWLKFEIKTSSITYSKKLPRDRRGWDEELNLKHAGKLLERGRIIRVHPKKNYFLWIEVKVLLCVSSVSQQFFCLLVGNMVIALGSSLFPFTRSAFFSVWYNVTSIISFSFCCCCYLSGLLWHYLRHTTLISTSFDVFVFAL